MLESNPLHPTKARHGRPTDGDALRGWLPVEVGAGAESLLAFHGHISRVLAARAPERTEEPDDDDDD